MTGSRLLQQCGQFSLPIEECSLNLILYEQDIRQSPQRTKADIVFNHISNQRTLHAFTLLGLEFVAMAPALERPPVLHVGEMMIPFEFRDSGDPL